MEIKGYKDEIVGVVPTADIVEGRVGLLVGHSFSHDFGSRTDLPGFRVPATTEEAKRARYTITWAVDNRSFPLFQPVPSFPFSVRSEFEGAQTHPFSATFYLSNPGNKEGLTIPSGTPALAFGRGTYGFRTADYIADSNLHTAGALVIVANAAEDTTDAGKLKYQSTMDDRVIGVVREWDSVSGQLTVDFRQ